MNNVWDIIEWCILMIVRTILIFLFYLLIYNYFTFNSSLAAEHDYAYQPKGAAIALGVKLFGIVILLLVSFWWKNWLGIALWILVPSIFLIMSVYVRECFFLDPLAWWYVDLLNVPSRMIVGFEAIPLIKVEFAMVKLVLHLAYFLIVAVLYYRLKRSCCSSERGLGK